MRSRGFTLLEVVLAIGLAGTVLALLATAIDLYLVRVDTSRTQVESAQLARTLLGQIADDLHAARYFSDSSTTSSRESGSPAEDSSTTASGPPTEGLFGTATELRIDRSAAWNWEYQTRLLDVTNTKTETDSPPLPANMPQTVRYLLGEGKELRAAELAATGVSQQPRATSYAGLYRQQLSTAAWLAQNSTTQNNQDLGNVEDAELIAPEVVDIAFAYYDGQQLLDEWDSAANQGLPTAVEIRLTLLKEPFELAAARSPSDRDELRRSKENLVEYRRFVNLTKLGKPHESAFPQVNNSSPASDLLTPQQ